MWFLCFRQYSTAETALQISRPTMWTAASSRADEALLPGWYARGTMPLFSFLSFLFRFSFIFDWFIILNPQPPVSGRDIPARWSPSFFFHLRPQPSLPCANNTLCALCRDFPVENQFQHAHNHTWGRRGSCKTFPPWCSRPWLVLNKNPSMSSSGIKYPR